MALNKTVFKTRTLTAIVFAIVMLIGLLINGYLFLSLFSIILMGCLYEYFLLIKKINSNKKWLLYFFAIPYILVPVFLMAYLGINFFEDDGYIIPNYLFVFPCTIIFSIWINDTMAYLVGSFIGKTPFSKISPKKTWEGTIGGALLCIIIIGTAAFFIPFCKAIAWYHWFFIAAICAVFGTLGDLLESKLKRLANIKDSGSFMPGHGGFLDRFDSLLVATPFVWLYIKVFI